MFTKLTIKNFKSIVDDTIELGRINVFIGENGCGKSNILEAVGMLSASKENKIDPDSLGAKGMRTISANQMLSAFENITSSAFLELITHNAEVINSKFELNNFEVQDYSNDDLRKLFLKMVATSPLSLQLYYRKSEYNILLNQIAPYVIYNANVKALRSIFKESLREPVGIHGENLDTFLANFDEFELLKIGQYEKLIDWVNTYVIDTDGSIKRSIGTTSKSTSNLYFKDRFINNDKAYFSAENANEGVLFLLFYLALFISKRTPEFFAIDNIETSLNPHLCRKLSEIICQLAKENNKQALITTHNPAILDGLNLNDDEIRLFEVYRTDEGHTKTRRIKVKPEVDGKKYKLSELWMRGHLGAISKNF